MAEIELPDGFQELKTQVAGHTFEASNAKAVGLLLDAKTGCVLKPLGKPECGERETKFYMAIQKALQTARINYEGADYDNERDNEVNLLVRLSEFVPKFYRQLELKVNHRELMFLKMENLAYGMLRPCIMDIKIGQRTWDPLANEEKRSVEEQKYLGSKKPLGLCLPGFQLYKGPHGEFIKHSKEYGKKLSVEGFRETIAMFLNAEQENKICETLINEILMQLQAIKKWFLQQHLLHFYASSLLLVYDYSILEAFWELHNKDYLLNGHGHGIQEKFLSLKPSKWIKVKMIDFAHVFPAENNSLDSNYLFGLENLIRIIENLKPTKQN